MRILYGIQATGNGHITRARALAPALKKAGANVTYLFSGRPCDQLFDMEMFGNFACKRGLTFATDKGRIQTWRTLQESHPVQLLRDITRTDVRKYDLVLSDFEPITAWASQLRKVPSLSISHQAAFFHPIPKVRGYSSSRMIMKHYAPTSLYFGVHWYHFGQAILPPLISPHESQRPKRNKVVVYLNFEALADTIELLTPFTDHEFHVFSSQSKQSLARPIPGHIQVHGLSFPHFHHHLGDSEGVISNAGFELASECISMGKKILMKPLQGQFEQLSNALALQQLDRGTVMNELNPRVVETWLAEPLPLKIPYPNLPEALAKWIMQGRWDYKEDLVNTLWRNIDAKDFARREDNTAKLSPRGIPALFIAS